MSGEGLAILVALAVAASAWAAMFLPGRQGIWPRTWAAAAVMSGTSVACLAAVGRLGDIVGPLSAVDLLIGLAAGGAWLVATHVGYRILAALFPSFGAQVRDLYLLRDGDTPRAQMIGPVVAMGVAEELLFRGVLHGLGGFALGLVAYTAVQAFERKWALAVAALLGGAVWGALFSWRTGLVAPVVAHVVWTAVLTFLWPLGTPEPAATRRGGAPAAPA